MLRCVLIAVIAVISAAGCAVHPLPEDVTGLNTNAIVFHIRCEARDAITKAIGRYLAVQPDDYSRQAGLALVNDRKPFSDVDLTKVNELARRNIRKYLPAAIAYDFTFDMSEQNTLGTQVDFLSTFTHGVLNLGLQGQNDRQRQTIRNFRISDRFDEILSPASVCVPGTLQPNLIYPIAGRIGLAELITTFVDLNEFENLAAAKDDKAKAPVIADTFSFQTIVSGSVNPKVILTPLGRGFQLLDASFSSINSRRDIHRVIVAVSLPVPKTAMDEAQGGFFRLTTAPFNKSSAEKNAIAEIYNQIERNILNNIVVRPN